MKELECPARSPEVTPRSHFSSFCRNLQLLWAAVDRDACLNMPPRANGSTVTRRLQSSASEQRERSRLNRSRVSANSTLISYMTRNVSRSEAVLEHASSRAALCGQINTVTCAPVEFQARHLTPACLRSLFCAYLRQIGLVPADRAARPHDKTSTLGVKLNDAG